MKKIIKNINLSNSLKESYSKGKRKAWNIGKKASEETKKKMSETRKRIGSGKWMKGFKHSEKTRNKLREILKNPSEKRLKYYSTISARMKGKKYALGYKFSEEQRKNKAPKIKRGKDSHFWKGGISTHERKIWLNANRRIRQIGNGGSHTLEDWTKLKAQYNWTCPCCLENEPLIKLTVDHIIAISKGGSNNIENIQPLCKSCNSRKHDKHIFYELQTSN
jgi:5-methylcytosine-specific restriction endonuclease McrA